MPCGWIRTEEAIRKDVATTRVGHTHVYMHCIAKTLLTELHLAILVLASVCLHNCPAPAPTTLPPICLNPPIAVRSSPPRFSVATSVPLSLASGYGARVYVCEKPLHPPTEDPIRRGELMAWGDGAGVAGRRTGRTVGPRGRGDQARWGWDSKSRRTASLNP